MYRDAAVALVTPLRDGMNLVAKEFVACQVASPGVLVLSSLAGAADTMREALRVLVKNGFMSKDDAIGCKQRLGGMLKYYYREAA